MNALREIRWTWYMALMIKSAQPARQSNLRQVVRAALAGWDTRGLMPPEPVTGQVIVMSADHNQKALDAVPSARPSPKRGG